MRLESGPARTDRNWWLVRTVVFLGIAAYFVYDGAVGWPEKIREAAELKLKQPPFDGRRRFEDLSEKPTGRDVERLVRGSPGTTNALHDLGEPIVTSGRDRYYASRYGYVKVTLGADGHATADWRPWFKDKSEVDQQFWWALVPGLPGLYCLYRLIKAATLKVVIDDEGMIYGGKRIAFADMVSLRDYSPKGWIDLYYKFGAREKKLRLDNQKVRLFDDIVAAICEVKGFRNEVKEYVEQKASQRAAEQAAADAPHDEGQKSPPTS
jgi:hypothetical protein